MIYPSQVESDAHIARARSLCLKADEAFVAAGLRESVRKNPKNSKTLNLTNLTHWCSGGLGITLENYHGCYTPEGKIWPQSFDQLMAPAFVALKIIMEDGLKKPLAER